MNKIEFLQTLNQALIELKIDDRTDIMYDYEEHFRIGLENGKTDAELINELGDPTIIAKQYITATATATVTTTTSSTSTMATSASTSASSSSPTTAAPTFTFTSAANANSTSSTTTNSDFLKKADPRYESEDKPIIISFVAACGLALFNLIFVLAPYIGIVGALIGLFAGAVGTTIGGIAMLLAPILSPLLPEFMSITNGFSTALMMSLGVGITALGLLMLIGMWYLVKYFWIGTVKYIKWNIKLIK